MSDVFISYARSTAAQAQQVAEALRALGHGVWRDDELPAHRAYAEVIEERLKAAKAVVVIWSEEATKSQWVRAEANVAREAGTLVQLRVDQATPPLPFNEIQCADLAGWSGDAEAAGWRKVVGSVEALLRPSGGGAAGGQATSGPRALSICVLPFANMSGDIEQEYFSDGISKDIITDLSKVSALSVVARNTAFTFKGKSLKIPQVARELNVSHVLEGSVRKAAGRARVKALKLKLVPEEKKAIEQRGTDNVEAYNLYLMARQTYVTGLESDPRRNETTIRLCKRATEIDPRYARAWALMALGQMLLRASHGRGDNGLAAAEQALFLDARMAEAHAVKARICAEEGRLEEAESEIQIALQIDPESFEVNKAAALLSFGQRQWNDAIRFWEKAITLMENDFASAGLLITCYTATGN